MGFHLCLTKTKYVWFLCSYMNVNPREYTNKSVCKSTHFKAQITLFKNPFFTVLNFISNRVIINLKLSLETLFTHHRLLCDCGIVPLKTQSIFCWKCSMQIGFGFVPYCEGISSVKGIEEGNERITKRRSKAHWTTSMDGHLS